MHETKPKLKSNYNGKDSHR